MYANALVDVRSRLEERVRSLYPPSWTTPAPGGTMTGEHGDGRLRSPALRILVRRGAAGIKAVFDPDGILNPGVKSPTGPDPFTSIKYDPADPLPSARAAAVLHQVETEREYDSCRLEMLDTTG
jgi:hypothetical protein